MNDSDSKTILIAEDNKDLREAIRIILEQSGFKVFEAGNGKQAIEIAKLHVPDLILMDLSMPVLNGIEASLSIRKLNQLSNIPILAASGDGYNGINLFADISKFGKGYIGYIAKPFDLEMLAEEINLILSKTQAAENIIYKPSIDCENAEIAAA